MLKEIVTHKEGSFPTPIKWLHETMKSHMLDRMLLLLLPVTMITTTIRTETLKLLSENA
jgi:hypothetical protein